MSRLQKVLDKKCPICGNRLVKIERAKEQMEYGEEIVVNFSSIECPECDYIEKDKGKRRNNRPNFKEC